MNEATKSAGLGVALCATIWACTGIWQFFAVGLIGMACTWVFSPPVHPQPRRRVREFVRVEIRDIERLAACYDYGGCKWAGDGCAGKPLVLGSGRGCAHTAGKRCLDDNPGAMRFASAHEPDCTCPHCDPD